MNEYLSEAIVLDKETSGDLDIRVSLFTKKFGKLKARAKSARRIVSKLSPHLEPGNVVRVRLIEKNGLQVVDALKQRFLPVLPSNLYFLNQIIAEGEPDLRLWQSIVSHNFSWVHILEILGWDPREAACALCAGEKPAFFSIFKQELFCDGCASKMSVGGLLCIGN
ncbi:MAG: hypothetical protein A3B25_02670 [Candidatus Ryanbacteria bacterium RIFCSPLOWO2_01_FULL_48_26]|uniref:DNA repair protein RecO n=1 Tax=Candidatus Ryanbacteria bacterium RIFCSPLOWO2_01_FULL_48_26 TaxID=1802126 RepID=A0A1G2GSQ0_9BACT|nr:MAG: hypothetical protein A3B25_02670 [Candidatus Ryanbacteria bacterium RIFCSPLOWO2_01_FULL_48_26]